MGRQVIVIGTGKVAPAVAAAFAASGRETLLAGRDDARTAGAARQASEMAGRPVRSAPLAEASFAEAALVVECVAEDADVKRAVLTAVESWLGAEAILVTNTSSLPLDELAAAVRRPERFGGLHFLHPAHLTGVVEVVAASTTDAATTAALTRWVAELGKRAIEVKRPTPGFVWNRLQMAVLRECLELVEQGIADPEAVDAAVSEGLAPRWLAAGPLATADLGGIAVFREIARQLYPHLSAHTEPTPLLDRAETDGGFYTWDAEDLATVERARAQALDFASKLPRPTRPAAEEEDLPHGRIP